MEKRGHLAGEAGKGWVRSTAPHPIPGGRDRDTPAAGRAPGVPFGHLLSLPGREGPRHRKMLGGCGGGETPPPHQGVGQGEPPRANQGLPRARLARLGGGGTKATRGALPHPKASAGVGPIPCLHPLTLTDVNVLAPALHVALVEAERLRGVGAVAVLALGSAPQPSALAPGLVLVPGAGALVAGGDAGSGTGGTWRLLLTGICFDVHAAGITRLRASRIPAARGLRVEGVLAGQAAGGRAGGRREGSALPTAPHLARALPEAAVLPLARRLPGH